MNLRFRGPRADRAPGNQVRDVLRGNRIEKLSPRRHAHVGEIQQKSARHAQAVIDVERIVQRRIIDQALPADRRPRFLKIDPHDHKHVLLDALRLLFQLHRIVDRSLGIMDRARPHNRQQAVVFPAQDRVGLVARAGHQFGSLLGWRKVISEHRR